VLKESSSIRIDTEVCQLRFDGWRTAYMLNYFEKLGPYLMRCLLMTYLRQEA
jgi:hypothetical protein